jgi:hypothetical protein
MGEISLVEFEIANRERLNQFLKEKLNNRKDSKQINLFLEKIKNDGKISINVDINNLYEIINDRDGRYKNIFELGYTDIEIKERYNRELPFFKKLKYFTDRFDENYLIKYALLNIGDLGSNYPGFGSGRMCIVLNSKFVNNLKKIFCLKYYSLKYFKIDGTFKEDEFRKDISNWDNVGILALEKHFDDIINCSYESWANLISNKKGWLEVLIFNDILVKNFESIRVKRNLYNYYNNLIMKDDQYLDEMDVINKRQFLSIVRFCERNGILIEDYAV